MKCCLMSSVNTPVPPARGDAALWDSIGCGDIFWWIVYSGIAEIEIKNKQDRSTEVSRRGDAMRLGLRGELAEMRRRRGAGKNLKFSV